MCISNIEKNINLYKVINNNIFKSFLYVTVSLIFIITSCHKNETPKGFIDKFYANKENLDSLVIHLKSNKNLDSLFQIALDAGLPDIKNKYPKEFERLKMLGITDASSIRNTCKICPRWYYLKTNWATGHPIYLIHNFASYEIDSIENVKGFYKIDNYKNETWGLGDNWKMFRFVDTIRDMKL